MKIFEKIAFLNKKPIIKTVSTSGSGVEDCSQDQSIFSLKDKYPNFEVGLHSYCESILTCVFLYKMKKRCKQITLMNVT